MAFRGLTWAIALTLAVAAAGCVSSGASPEVKARQEYERGLKLQDRGNFPDALAAYDSAIELDPSRSEAYAARGYV